jgi:hypothetical protein
MDAPLDESSQAADDDDISFAVDFDISPERHFCAQQLTR